MTLAPAYRCPACKRRGTCRDHQGIMDTFERYEVTAWQCVECGTVFEKDWRGKVVTGVAPIVLQPDELQRLRRLRSGDQPAKRRGRAVRDRA